jgi:TatD DNase family protein
VWFDSHCHLHLCEERTPVESLVEAARADGVTRVLTVGIDVESSRRAARIARDQSVFCSAGVHPNSADEFSETALKEIESILNESSCVAVGETGLDFFRKNVAHSVQEEAFEAHVDLAIRHKKALVIHTRKSASRALDVLTARDPPERIVFHCWSGSAGELQRAIGIGSFISFAGNVSFPSAGDLREHARNVPPDRLLVETDAPFLTPVPHRGRPNEPRYVSLVGAAVAEARGEAVEAVAEQTAQNARVLFGIDG